jgi:hypothetical protein
MVMDIANRLTDPILRSDRPTQGCRSGLHLFIPENFINSSGQSLSGQLFA